MNALRLSQNNLEEMISFKQFVITGVLETGEITVAVVSPTEREIIEKLLSSESDPAMPAKCADKIISTLYKLSEIHGNNSRELIKTGEQLIINKYSDGKEKFDFRWKFAEICPKNRLQVKKFRDY